VEPILIILIEEEEHIGVALFIEDQLIGLLKTIRFLSPDSLNLRLAEGVAVIPCCIVAIVTLLTLIKKMVPTAPRDTAPQLIITTPLLFTDQPRVTGGADRQRDQLTRFAAISRIIIAIITGFIGLAFTISTDRRDTKLSITVSQRLTALWACATSFTYRQRRGYSNIEDQRTAAAVAYIAHPDKMLSPTQTRDPWIGGRDQTGTISRTIVLIADLCLGAGIGEEI